MNTQNPQNNFPHSREVADKSKPHALEAAIKMALATESASVRRNTGTFHKNRDKTAANISDLESLRTRACKIKEEALGNLPELLTQLEAVVKQNGGHLFVAQDAQAARDYIAQVCRQKNARIVVKGKSMTSEEIKLNARLEADGIDVAETDLAEFILQYSGEQPSHIVGPAIHMSRERITELFKREFSVTEPLDSAEALTAFARKQLRRKFLDADVGITGANFVAADTGAIAIVENEGNIRLSYTIPPVHIAIAGVEKVLPRQNDFGLFLELLGMSATGQRLPGYTSILQAPIKTPFLPREGLPDVPREFHLVLIDNGRMALRKDDELKEALYCIRCSACLNSCGNFQAVGGHAFGGETYSGGIGGTWEAATGGLEKARFSELCTGCTRCLPQCPVKINIPRLNTVLQSRLDSTKSGKKRRLVNALKMARLGSRIPTVANWVMATSFMRTLTERFAGVDRRRPLPRLSPKYVWAQAVPKGCAEKFRSQKVLIFGDIYTGLFDASRAVALHKILTSLGFTVAVSPPRDAGRAALSQGFIEEARSHAQKTADMLREYAKSGHVVLVPEPTVLSLFKRDYGYLLSKGWNDELNDRIYEPISFLDGMLNQNDIDVKEVFTAKRDQAKAQIFYHAHCQEKSLGIHQPTFEWFQRLGFDVILSDVACCGMAGSFGYKKEFYELSMNVGEQLFKMIRGVQGEGEVTVVASGMSCRDQIFDGLGIRTKHPLEVFAELL